MNSTTSKSSIALLGLGIMGSGMARRLLGAGFPLTVYNRNAARAEPLAAAGARSARSPREAAADADTIISMVADDAASRAVWLGENGALAGAKSGAALIECSTVSVGWINELAAAAKARGCELIDAPVTGSKVQAASGELNFLAGGAAAALETVRPILSAMGRSIIHIGPTGSGALLKLINNFLCGVQAASLAEAMALIERSGLDRGRALEMLLNGAGGSLLLKTLAPRMTSRDYTPNFLLALMAKDLTYALQEGSRHALRFETAAAALEVFKKAIASGYGEKDFSAIIEPLRQKPGASANHGSDKHASA
jgi:3-hydroxyisobutyrate dehydrogenase